MKNLTRLLAIKVFLINLPLILFVMVVSSSLPSSSVVTVVSAKASALSDSILIKPSIIVPQTTGSDTASLQVTRSGVPGQLETFTQQTIGELAEHLPFRNWQNASLDYTPLGPGTHSWLVTVEDGSKPLGFLIITSNDLGGYVLSEYGIGSELPYSLAPLEQTLVSAGILKANSRNHSNILGSLPQGSRVEALYHSISPYWKVTLKGKASVYIHAVTYDIIPAPSVPKTAYSSKSTSANHPILDSSKGWKPNSVISTEGEQDPYQNLNWLTNPTLPIKSGNDIIHLLLPGSRKSLIYTAEEHNIAFGAPFSLTGWQSWTTNNKQASQVIYITIPQRNTDLIRFVPADNLIGPGKFREDFNS